MNPSRQLQKKRLHTLYLSVPRHIPCRTSTVSCVSTRNWECGTISGIATDGRFPDVEKTLLKLKAADKLELMMFSNGSHFTLQNARKTHEVLKSVFPNDKILSVDDVRAYKPSRASYSHLLKSAGKMDRPEDVVLISSNPFDICGARSMGMRAVWISRTNTSWIDQLGEGPTWIVKSFSELTAFDPTKWE